jgi:putative transposase
VPDNPKIHRRKQIRLKEYDYSQPGEYFVTICAKDKKHLFGKIVEESIRLSPTGEIIKQCWESIPKHFPNVNLDEYIIMPDHVHGIVIVIEIDMNFCRGEVTSPLRKPTLGNIVAYFKYQSTKMANAIQGTPGYRIWQRNYYDRIIRDEKELNNMRAYIFDNPVTWCLNEENPDKT